MTYYSLMFAYAFKGQVNVFAGQDLVQVFAGQVKIVSH